MPKQSGSAKVKSNIPIKLIARAAGATEGQVKAAARAIERALRGG